MLKRNYAALCLVFGLLMGCGTPPEVKQLSAAQIEYFNIAIEAVKLQSDTLIAAAGQIEKMAAERLDQLEQDQLAGFKKLTVETIPGKAEGDRGPIADRMFAKFSEIAAKKAESKANLAEKMAAIRAKTDELNQYIGKMKEVQIALDAYLQSEQAGERILNDVLQQPTVQGLLGSIRNLIPKVRSTTSSIEALIGGLGAS